MLPPVRSIAALLAASTALAACASVPDVGPPASVRPASAYATGRSFAAATVDWPSEAWWTGYGDPQLTALVEEALKDSPSLAAAAARVRRAEALAGQARSALQPNLSLSGGATAIVGGGTGPLAAMAPTALTGTGYGLLRGGFDLDLWGRNRASLAAATSEAEAARADAAATRLSLSTAVAAAYADLAQLYADREAATQALEVRRRTVELLNQRFANGLENRGGAEQAEAGLAQAEAEIAALDEAIGLNRNRIAALLGAGPDRGLSIKPPAPSAIRAFGLPDRLAADLVGRRPDVLAARLRAEAAVGRTRAAKAAFYPNVNLSVVALGLAPDLGALGASNLALGAAGPALSLPIFDGGRLGAQYRAARADHDAAVADYDRAVVEAFHEVADAAASARALSTRLARSREAVAAAEAAYAVAQDRYNGGLATYLEVLRAEDLLISSRRVLAELRTRAFSLDIALVRALGGGFAGRV